MKKILALTLSLLLVLGLLGVSTAETMKQITLPAGFFQTEGEAIDTSELDEMYGEDAYVINPDGSMTITMTEQQHQELMAETSAEMEAFFVELLDGTFASVKAVEANDDYSQVTLTVDQEAYLSSLDVFASITIGTMCMFYHMLNGDAMDDISVEIVLVDEASGTAFDTMVYPIVTE